MKRTSFDQWPCSIARTIDLVGDWWTPLVLRECYFGVRRFDELQRSLQIGRNILAQRLDRLVEEGMLERRVYQERPVRREYVLTDKGRDFYPVLAAMSHWGDTWLSAKAGPPIQLHHTVCDADMHAEVVCSNCREPIRVREVRATFGPGYPPKLRERAAGRMAHP